jgi:O-antigen/teichoic acid export membrane protein
MRREFILNILFLVFINLLIKPFFIFGIDLAVQNRTGAEYGLYFALLNLTYLFQIVSDFGLQNFNNRHVSRYPHLLEKYLPDLLTIKVALSGLYVVLSLAAGLLIGYRGGELRVLAVLLLNLVLVQLIFFLRSNVSGLGRYRLDSLLSSLDKLLMLLTGGLLLWTDIWPGPLTIEAFAWSQTVALIATAAIVALLLQGLAGFPLRLHWAALAPASRARLVVLLRQSLPYALVILLMTAYTRLDAVLLERLLPDGKVHADVYAGAYRLLDASNMLGYLFATLLLPMFARMLGQREPVRPLVALSFKLIWAGSVTLAAAVCFARADLIGLMMPARATAYRWDTLGVLIWTFVPVSTTYIFSTLLTADQRLREMNRFFIAGIVFDVALNLWLIPRYQAFGAAIATLATQAFIAAAMVWLCARQFGFRAAWGGVLRVAGFAVAVVAGDWLIFHELEMPWFWKFAFALFSGAAWMLVFQLVSLRALLRFAENKAG